MCQQMTQRTSRSRRGRGPAQPLITKELERLRQKPPRAGKSVPLSNLDRLAILNGIRDGDAPIRIADQWNISLSSIVRVKTKLYDDPLSIFEYHVVIHQGKGDYQCVFCGESKSRQSQCQRHVLAHFFTHHIAQNIDLGDIPEVF